MCIHIICILCFFLSIHFTAIIGLFHTNAIVNIAAVYLGVQVSL